MHVSYLQSFDRINVVVRENIPSAPSVPGVVLEFDDQLYVGMDLGEAIRFHDELGQALARVARIQGPAGS